MPCCTPLRPTSRSGHWDIPIGQNCPLPRRRRRSDRVYKSGPCASKSDLDCDRNRFDHSLLVHLILHCSRIKMAVALVQIPFVACLVIKGVCNAAVTVATADTHTSCQGSFCMLAETQVWSVHIIFRRKVKVICAQTLVDNGNWMLVQPVKQRC